MKQLALVCHKCKHTWAVNPPLGRRDECPQCQADAKCCRNCRHFDQGAHHECREDQAEWVKEKTQGNFCGWFEPRGAFAIEDEAARAKGKLDQLFKIPTDAAPRAPGGNIADELQRFLASKK